MASRIKLTNLDKEFWPAHGERPPLTKRDLIDYYVKLPPVLLPHLKDRPLTLTRYPNGIEGEPFYQKHYGQPIPAFVETVVDLVRRSNDARRRVHPLQQPADAGLAGPDRRPGAPRLDGPRRPASPTPTIRPRPSPAPRTALDASVLNYPDYMVFDLDPYIYSGKEGKGEEPEYNQRGWQKTVEIALSLKELLDQLRLSSYMKTSGKTGLHIYVPLLRHYDYDAMRAATQTIGRFLVQQHPKDLTMEWDTSKRAGKVFFDANQNTRGKNAGGPVLAAADAPGPASRRRSPGRSSPPSTHDPEPDARCRSASPPKATSGPTSSPTKAIFHHFYRSGQFSLQTVK